MSMQLFLRCSHNEASAVVCTLQPCDYTEPVLADKDGAAQRKCETNARLLYISDYCFKLDNAQTVCIRFFMKAAQAFFQFEKPIEVNVVLLLLIFDESDKAICQHGGKMQRLHQRPIQAI